MFRITARGLFLVDVQVVLQRLLNDQLQIEPRRMGWELGRDDPERDQDGVFDLRHRFGGNGAKMFVQALLVDRPNLIQLHHRIDFEAAFWCLDRHFDGLGGRWFGRADSRDDGGVASAVADVVLQDEGRASLLDLNADRRVEVDQIHLAARRAGYRFSSWSRLAHTSALSTSHSLANSRSSSRLAAYPCSSCSRS